MEIKIDLNFKIKTIFSMTENILILRNTIEKDDENLYLFFSDYFKVKTETDIKNINENYDIINIKDIKITDEIKSRARYIWIDSSEDAVIIDENTVQGNMKKFYAKTFLIHAQHKERERPPFFKHYCFLRNIF